jgi:carboxylate-amine ligase
MTTLAFKSSANFTIGVELELQIINPVSYDLTAGAKDLLRNIKDSAYSERIKPEITQSMIEINSSVHDNPTTLLTELVELKNYLIEQAEQLKFAIAGGGTHPFQRWSAQAIFPAPRFREASRVMGYMAKNFTVFGLHVHLGCAQADDAIYLCHMLSNYVPHLIALSASSPYYQAVDTAYNSARINIVSTLPHSGVMPYLTNWQAFTHYFNRMMQLGVVKAMKDFHWDIRPKPEFGTVEVRVCDMPLTLEQTAAIAAYVQTLGHYLLTNKPSLIKQQAYDVYEYNRFQASRFGFMGDYINPVTEQHSLIKDSILETIKQIEPSAEQLSNEVFIEQISSEVTAGKNDASWLREIFKKVGALDEVVRRQCCLWKGEF